jgi:hypothetical protein
MVSMPLFEDETSRMKAFFLGGRDFLHEADVPSVVGRENSFLAVSPPSFIP